ncbi:hypothetical protein IC620_16675 [Hazenella sp. IB182357]|uniref:Uncharacterized protein n=1 Tax=Polycladospora coralii TaxID=2771432 RepID=A0A926RV98_9BACL|nr:hypothetical protein [Polycladospora coralii]MBD1373978.1 hypothetical protein [Polycladospora coralii]
MVNSLGKNIVLSILTLSILVSFGLPMNVFANDSRNPTEEEIKALADQLEFLMEEALIVENGVHTYDFDKIEKEFGAEFSNELKAMTVDYKPIMPNVTKNIQAASSDWENWKGCMTGALMDHFGVTAVTAAIEGGLWAYLKKKAFTEAAKLLLKAAVGGNAVAIAGTLIYYAGTCTAKYPNW